MNKSLSINGVVNHYKGHDGKIKLFFRTTDMRRHSGEDYRSFTTVRPCVVSIGNWIDDHIDFTFVLKNRYVSIIETKPHSMWLLEVDPSNKIYKSPDGDYEYHDTELKFIASKSLLDKLEGLYLSSNGVSEASEDCI